MSQTTDPSPKEEDQPCPHQVNPFVKLTEEEYREWFRDLKEGLEE